MRGGGAVSGTCAEGGGGGSVFVLRCGSAAWVCARACVCACVGKR